MSKLLRICHMPQIGTDIIFYVPVNSVKEGKKMMDLLSCYDLFQLENRIKPDYSSMCGLEQWNEETQEWEQWELETEDNYFDDVDEYLEGNEEIQVFNEFIFDQLKGDLD